MTELYHGTYHAPDGPGDDDLLQCLDLIGGVDGMVHFHTNKESIEGTYAYMVQCDTSLALDDIPTLPDMRDWNPFDMAEALEKQGVLSREERAELEIDIPAGHPARTLDVEQLRLDLEYDLNTDTRAFSLDELVEMGREDLCGEYDDDGDDDGGDDFDLEHDFLVPLENGEDCRLEDLPSDEARYQARLNGYDNLLKMRHRLFEKLDEKGVYAFKYVNRYEPTMRGQTSVAVLSHGILREPDDGGPIIREPSADYSQPADAPKHIADPSQLTLKDGKQMFNGGSEDRMLGEEFMPIRKRPAAGGKHPGGPTVMNITMG